ncbi:STAS domain-containing protein [Streptomyces zaehneri]|uniref:STAS domain-containing protein n=1 Tax=Streptomyces zaehneri TaxID=3051180 RepID=UPI0028D5BA67|nr:STAS domain-containing protein [Streptomyces sp. DSM 40713]
MDLKMSYEHVSEYVTVVTLAGELDVYTAPGLRQLLVDMVNHERWFLVLDLSAVTNIDSTGLGVVTGGLKRVRAHDGMMALVVPHEILAKVFRITGLIKVFPIFDTVDPAVEFLGRWMHGDLR